MNKTEFETDIQEFVEVHFDGDWNTYDAFMTLVDLGVDADKYQKTLRYYNILMRSDNDFSEFSKQMTQSRIEDRLGGSDDTPLCKSCGVFLYHKFFQKHDMDSKTNLVTCDICWENQTGERFNK